MSRTSTLIRKRADLLTAAFLLVLVFVSHSLSPNATSFDSRWAVYTALSIIREGNTDLNEYVPLLERDGFYAIECVAADGTWRYPLKERSECADGRLYNWYPVAVPFLAAPVVDQQCHSQPTQLR